jgi:hypothetical protein
MKLLERGSWLSGVIFVESGIRSFSLSLVYTPILRYKYKKVNRPVADVWGKLGFLQIHLAKSPHIWYTRA